MALKLHLLDSFALAGGGHHAHMAGFIHRLAAERGIAVEIYGHRKALTERLGYPVTPIFTRSMHAPFTRDPFDGPLVDLLRGQHLFADDLAAIDFAAGDLVLVPTATLRELSGLLIRLGRGGAAPRIAALFHGIEDSGGSLAAGSLGGALGRNVGRSLASYRGPLWLGATNAPLADALATALAQPVAVAAGTICFADPPPGAPRAAGPARVGFPGSARAEKGSGIALAVAAMLAARGDVHAVVQRHGGGGAAAEPPPPGVECIDAALDEGAFAALIASLDLIVLPYDAARYASAVSGVFDYGAAFGVPAVVPAGTTMAAWIASGAATGLSFVGGDARAVAQAAADALADLPGLRARAQALAPTWRAAHSGQRWFEDVLAWAIAA